MSVCWTLLPCISSSLARYGAVVRGQNAYIPPGARKGVGGALSPPTNPSVSSATAATKQEIPKVSVNGPDGAAVVQAQSPSDKDRSPPSGVTAASRVCQYRCAPRITIDSDYKQDPTPAFRVFIVEERQRLHEKRQKLAKNELKKCVDEFVRFSETFKVRNLHADMCRLTQILSYSAQGTDPRRPCLHPRKRRREATCHQRES